MALRFSTPTSRFLKQVLSLALCQKKAARLVPTTGGAKAFSGASERPRSFQSRRTWYSVLPSRPGQPQFGGSSLLTALHKNAQLANKISIKIIDTVRADCMLTDKFRRRSKIQDKAGHQLRIDKVMSKLESIIFGLERYACTSKNAKSENLDCNEAKEKRALTEGLGFFWV